MNNENNQTSKDLNKDSQSEPKPKPDKEPTSSQDKKQAPSQLPKDIPKLSDASIIKQAYSKEKQTSDKQSPGPKPEDMKPPSKETVQPSTSATKKEPVKAPDQSIPSTQIQPTAEKKPVTPQASPTPAQPQPTVSPEESAKIVQRPITRVPPPSAAQATATKAEPDSVDRRTFIKWLAIGWGAFAAIVAGYGTLVLRFLFPNVLFEPKQSFRVGFPDDFEIGKVSEKFKAKFGVWIVRDAEKIYALSTTCTHLGCTPNWLDNENKFKCPCHGSGFYKTGINFEGPAPRPLERFRIGLSDDGEIIIDKNEIYQQEKGEWTNPESYLPV